MTTLKDLTDRIVSFRDARNWKQFHNPKDMALSLMLEAGEVAEHFQWKKPDEIEAHLAGEGRSALGDELSDVLYWVLLMAHDLGVDLPEAFDRKMEKNGEKYPVELARDRHSKYTSL